MTDSATPSPGLPEDTPPATLEPELSKNNNITKIHHTEPSELEYREWAMEICSYDGFGLTRDRAVQVLKRLRQEWLDALAADNARLRERQAEDAKDFLWLRKEYETLERQLAECREALRNLDSTRRLLKEARPYVVSAMNDDDMEARSNSAALLQAIDIEIDGAALQGDRTA